VYVERKVQTSVSPLTDRTSRSKRKTSDSQGVLQDGDVGDSALPLFNSGRSGRDEAERDGGGDGGDGELHYELEVERLFGG
jgi:hypothetical protein